MLTNPLPDGLEASASTSSRWYRLSTPERCGQVALNPTVRARRSWSAGNLKKLA